MPEDSMLCEQCGATWRPGLRNNFWRERVCERCAVLCLHYEGICTHEECADPENWMK